MRYFYLPAFIGLVLSLCLLGAWQNSPGQQKSKLKSKKDYFDINPEIVAGDFESLGKSAAGRQVYVRRGAITHFVIQPAIESLGDPDADWTVTAYFGQNMQRFDFRNEQEARQELQQALEFFKAHDPATKPGS